MYRWIVKLQHPCDIALVKALCEFYTADVESFIMWSGGYHMIVDSTTMCILEGFGRIGAPYESWVDNISYVTETVSGAKYMYEGDLLQLIKQSCPK